MIGEVQAISNFAMTGLANSKAARSRIKFDSKRRGRLVIESIESRVRIALAKHILQSVHVHDM